MMVDGAEESQLKGPIDVLAPYTCILAAISVPTRLDLSRCASRQVR